MANAKKQPMNLLYAQSGGPTAVINATAASVIAEARKKSLITHVYAAQNGILGVLREELIDTAGFSTEQLKTLSHTPGAIFGSCRFKLKNQHEQQAHFERLVAVFKAHHIGYFLYNGGNDSADTAQKVAQFSQAYGYAVQCIGVPKTIDNDLVVTDNCPGFGSVAKYVATSIQEASIDLRAMYASSTKVFILEVMGRHAGWIAAAAGVAAKRADDAPQIILFPEIAFNVKQFLAQVKAVVERVGWCSIIVSEGVRDQQGHFLSETTQKDAFGHAQLGGVAPYIAQLITEQLGYKNHWAVSDYLQRAASHIVSKTDYLQAQAVGKAAVQFAMQGLHGVMPVIKRTSQKPYQWEIASAPLTAIANYEKKMPKSYIRKDGYGITAACRHYLEPLMAGEIYPAYENNGLPQYCQSIKKIIKKKLPKYKVAE